VEGAIDVTLRRRFLSRRQRKVIKVDPKYTSQECPNCRALEKKSLSERVHRCDCGLTIGRDHAAAFVLERGLRLQAQTAGS
jgi:putative transposase